MEYTEADTDLIRTEIEWLLKSLSTEPAHKVQRAAMAVALTLAAQATGLPAKQAAERVVALMRAEF